MAGLIGWKEVKLDDKFLTVDDLASRWKVHSTTIRNWMSQDKAPPCTHINGAVRFSIKDVEVFEEDAHVDNINR